MRALFPDSGPVAALLIGEAPGPGGADKSGIPFWGDRAGKLLYCTLKALEMAQFPESVWGFWSGTELKRHSIRPTLKGVAITNAFDRCPTDDGTSFRSPKADELTSCENIARLQRDVDKAVAMSVGGDLKLITLGESARAGIRLLQPLEHITHHHLAHPSSQGLLARQLGHGKGETMQRLREEWAAQLKSLLVYKADLDS